MSPGRILCCHGDTTSAGRIDGVPAPSAVFLPAAGGRRLTDLETGSSRRQTIIFLVALAAMVAVLLLPTPEPLTTPSGTVELTDKQRGVAENLTVGETTYEQVGLEVDGFLCDGIVSRINPDGILRGDELCRACVIAWWEKKGVLIPIAGAGVITGVVIADDDPQTASPSGL